jgi:hypothetical protein
MLFAKIVPNCKKPALDGRDGGWHWFTERWIEYEDHVDTSIEYTELNAIERDC